MELRWHTWQRYITCTTDFIQAITHCQNYTLEQNNVVQCTYSTQGLFIWAEVISVTEKTFRQVYKRDLALLWNNMKSCIAFIWDGNVFPGTEISLADGQDLGNRDNFYPIWTQLSRLAGKISVYTSQNLHHSGKLYAVSGKHFSTWTEQQYLTCRNVFSATEITSAHMNRPLETQYSEWAVGPLSNATCLPMFMQFTGGHQPVQRFYWPENAIDWLREC